MGDAFFKNVYSRRLTQEAKTSVVRRVSRQTCLARDAAREGGGKDGASAAGKASERNQTYFTVFKPIICIFIFNIKTFLLRVHFFVVFSSGFGLDKGERARSFD